MEMNECAATSEQDAPRKQQTYGRLLLPVIKLKNSTSSKLLEQRLNYLWSSAHAMLATSPALAHTMASTIMETARQSATQLPANVLDYLCQQCGGLIVPSISADVRVVPQHHKTPINRKLSRAQRKQNVFQNGGNAGAPARPRRERLQNVVCVSCHRCGFANLRHGASVMYKPKEKKVHKRPRDDGAAPNSKRVKQNEAAPPAVDGSAPTTITTAIPATSEPPPPPEPQQRSIFAAPPSPPRRLLDGKKKKKKTAPAAATVAVKSSLNSFLSNLKK